MPKSNMKHTNIIVAIDGPAGAGKSTVASGLARALGATLVETGAIYRAVAYKVLQSGANLGSNEAVAEIAKKLIIDFKFDGICNKVIVEGKDVTDKIRTPDISAMASKLSAYPQVRAALLQLQRNFANRGSVVAEGRDIGTVVFPNAHYKFFLTADPRIRAVRRYKQLESMGKTPPPLDELLREIEKRDKDDSCRKIAPLRPAPDAEIIDSTTMSAQQVIDMMLEQIKSDAKFKTSKT